MMKHGVSSTLPRARRVLILGYGNPGRRDDGLGPALAERFQEADLPGVRVESGYQLNIEDAAAVAQHELVIFADADRGSEPPFLLRPLEPRTGAMEFTTHSVSPEGVLGLAHDVFGAETEGFSLAIRGYDFDGFGEGLSDEAELNLNAAVDFLRTSLNREPRTTPK